MQAGTAERGRRPSHRSRERACGGKVRFRDHKEAVAFLHGAENARRRAAEDAALTTHRAVRTYECTRCHGYHVTSQLAVEVR